MKVVNFLCGHCGDAKRLVVTDRIVRLTGGRISRVLWLACERCAL